jgi:hypothetical protein
MNYVDGRKVEVAEITDNKVTMLNEIVWPGGATQAPKI